MTRWRPSASVEVLRLRARMRTAVRAYFEAGGVLEVDTPTLSRAAPTEPHIAPLTTQCAATGPRPLFLQSSPELPMKRLLAAGVGDCWQLARVYRDGERGRWHHPEFDLLEWYRVGRDHHGLMDDVEAVLAAATAPVSAAPGAALRLSYADAFRDHVDLDPLSASLETIRSAALDHGADDLPALDRDGWLDRLLVTVVVPSLPADRPVFVHDWPASQAALARLDPADPRLASRFELFWRGVELANGFHELADPREQRARFEADNRARAERGLASVPVDERMLAALEAGLPDCAGVALGFDRLVMIAVGAATIDEVLAFPIERS